MDYGYTLTNIASGPVVHIHSLPIRVISRVERPPIYVELVREDECILISICSNSRLYRVRGVSVDR